MSSDPKFIPLLIGMGIQRLSVTPHSIPELKEVIRSIDVGQGEEIAAHALSLELARRRELFARRIEKDLSGSHHVIRTAHGSKRSIRFKSVRIRLMTAGCSQVTIRPLFQRPLVCWPADDAWPRSGDAAESLGSTSVGMQDLAGLPSREVLAPCKVLTVDLSLVATRHSARPSADAAFGAADVQAAKRHGSPSGLWQANPVAGIPPGEGEKSTRPSRASGAERQKPVCPVACPAIAFSRCGNRRDACANSGRLEPAAAHHSSCVPRVVFHDEGQ